MPLILALGKQRQVDLCVFEDILIYTVNSRPSGGYKIRTCLKKKKLTEIAKIYRQHGILIIQNLRKF